MSDLAKLIGLARITRTIFERVARKEGYPSNLGGLCYDASCFLRKMAKAQGIQTDLGETCIHYFVLHGDTVIDVTSTQFGQEEKVAVLPLEKAKTIGTWWDLQHRLTYNPDTINHSLLKVADDVNEEIEGGIGEAEL